MTLGSANATIADSAAGVTIDASSMGSASLLTLTGSGPAIFAVAASRAESEPIGAGLAAGLAAAGLAAEIRDCRLDHLGARVLPEAARLRLVE